MMEGWKEHRFGDIAEFPPKVQLKKDHDYPFVMMEEIDAGFKYVKTGNEKTYSGSGAKFENGDTLFARITPCLENGKIAQISNLNKPAFGSTELFVFRGKKDISDTDFIYYLSKTDWFKQNAVNSMVGASGRQRADAKFVSDTIVNLPPLPIQRKIASILSAYDDLIENNLKRIKLLEEMAQKTYEEWFVKFRIDGVKLPINKETGLPDGWESKRLKDTDISLIDGDRGINYPNKEEFFEQEYCLFLNTGNVTPDGFDFSKLQFITKEKDAELRKGKMQSNDIVLTTRGTIGNVAFYKANIPYKNVRINSGMLIIRSGENTILSNYLFQIFISSSFKKQLKLFSYGAAQPQLPVNTLKNIIVVIPTIGVQKKFSNIIESILYLSNTFQNQNQKLKEARDILLPRLMTGMIDVEKM